MPNHTPEEGWVAEYYKLFGGLITHPLANGLKDFIRRTVRNALKDQATTILERVNELYEEYGKGDGEYHDIIWYQDPRIELPQEALKKVSSLLTHLINQQ